MVHAFVGEGYFAKISHGSDNGFGMEIPFPIVIIEFVFNCWRDSYMGISDHWTIVVNGWNKLGSRDSVFGGIFTSCV